MHPLTECDIPSKSNAGYYGLSPVGNVNLRFSAWSSKVIRREEELTQSIICNVLGLASGYKLRRKPWLRTLPRTPLGRAKTNYYSLCPNAQLRENGHVNRRSKGLWDQSQLWILPQRPEIWSLVSYKMSSLLHFYGSSFIIRVLCLQRMSSCGPNIPSSSFSMRVSYVALFSQPCARERQTFPENSQGLNLIVDLPEARPAGNRSRYWQAFQSCDFPHWSHTHIHGHTTFLTLRGEIQWRVLLLPRSYTSASFY